MAPCASSAHRWTPKIWPQLWCDLGQLLLFSLLSPIMLRRGLGAGPDNNSRQLLSRTCYALNI